MLTYDHNLKMDAVPNDWILNIYISQKGIIILLKDEDKDKYGVVSFAVEDKGFIAACFHKELQKAKEDFRNQILRDLNLEEEDPALKEDPLGLDKFQDIQEELKKKYGDWHKEPFRYPNKDPFDPPLFPPFKYYEIPWKEVGKEPEGKWDWEWFKKELEDDDPF